MARDDWQSDDAALTVLIKPLKPSEIRKLEKRFQEDCARWRLEQQMDRPPKRRFAAPTGAALVALQIKVMAVNDRLAAKGEAKRKREAKAAEVRRAQRMQARMLRRRFEHL